MSVVPSLNILVEDNIFFPEMEYVMRATTELSLADHGVLYETLNSLIEEGESFAFKKSDVATTVGIVSGTIAGFPHDVLVKRFNFRNMIDHLLKVIFGSRAKHLWRISVKLYEMGLPVPEPLLYIEVSVRHRHSFYISSVIEDADDLGSIYKKGPLYGQKDIAGVLGKTISQWHMKGAVHGDLKWSNILFQHKGDGWIPFIIDLDQAKLFRKPRIKGVMKDLIRFYRGGLEQGAEEWVEKEFFPAYLASISDEIKRKLDLDDVKNIALKQWVKKGRRRL